VGGGVDVKSRMRIDGELFCQRVDRCDEVDRRAALEIAGIDSGESPRDRIKGAALSVSQALELAVQSSPALLCTVEVDDVDAFNRQIATA